MGDNLEILRNSRCPNSVERLVHLDILVSPPGSCRKLAFQMPFRFRQPLSQANKTPDQPKKDADACQNSEYTACHPATSSARIEKAICVESLGGMSDINQGEI